MPIHHRIPIIISQGISRLAPVGSKVLQSDKLLLNQAWKGYKHKSSIVGGIRTGLFAGSVIGPFINKSADNPEVYGPQDVYEPKTSSPYQARSGRGGFSNKYNKHKRFNRKCRCARPRKYKSSRNRF